MTTIRELKDKGVAVYFEEQNINTLDAKSEMILSIFSGHAQEESRNISENVTWGIRKRFERGVVFLPYKHFLGYTKGANGLPEIVEEKAKIVRLIYELFLKGRTIRHIAKYLTKKGI